MASTFEIVTTLTIAVIGIILTLYVIVLKKKGWLTDENMSGTSYLCPNPECRKIFERPVKLTDLSTWPARAYLACPHCGLDLGTISPTKANTAASDLASKMQNQKPDASLHLKAAKPPERPKPISDNEPFNMSKKPVSPLQAKPAVQASLKTPEAPEIREEKKLQSENTRNCPHYFGYVKTLPKNTPIPDECMWCPRIVKCLTGAEKIEA